MKDVNSGSGPNANLELKGSIGSKGHEWKKARVEEGQSGRGPNANLELKRSIGTKGQEWKRPRSCG